MIQTVAYLIAVSVITSIYFIVLHRINKRYNEKIEYFSEAYQKLEFDYMNLLLERGDNNETVVFRDGRKQDNPCKCNQN